MLSITTASGYACPVSNPTPHIRQPYTRSYCATPPGCRVAVRKCRVGVGLNANPTPDFYAYLSGKVLCGVGCVCFFENLALKKKRKKRRKVYRANNRDNPTHPTPATPPTPPIKSEEEVGI